MGALSRALPSGREDGRLAERRERERAEKSAVGFLHRKLLSFFLASTEKTPNPSLQLALGPPSPRRSTVGAFVRRRCSRGSRQREKEAHSGGTWVRREFGKAGKR